MKKLSSFLFLLLLVSAVSAQSGRKIRGSTPSTPASVPQVKTTQDVDTTPVAKDESGGYSETAPSAPRKLSPRSRRKDIPKKTSAPAVKTPTPAATPAEGEEETIKVDASLITIPVSVTDRNGFYIPDLQQKDFKIFENGVEQEVAYFGTTDKPFTVVLLIDVSPSTSYKIEEIQAAASAFVDLLKPQDQVMVIQFDSSVDVLTELTADRDKIKRAIRKTGFGDGTSLYDAVDFSLRRKLSKIEGRKAIVLFTDGVDTTSNRSSYETTLEDAEESEAAIFPIYYNTFLNNITGGGGGVMSSPPIIGMPGGIGGGQAIGITGEEYARGRGYLTELAGITGGKMFRAESTQGGLINAFESIAEELRRQYNIGYYPAESGAAGDRKQIKVRVYRPKLIVRARDSYIVGETKNGS